MKTRVFIAALASPSASVQAQGQPVFVGANLHFAGIIDAPQTLTAISAFEANAGGFVTSATFGWSATGCPGAVKIKFFRPLGFGNFHFVAERGPFDVTNPLQPAGTVPPVTQTVALDPPVALRKGDVIAITNVTSCGGPTWSVFGIPLPGLQPQWTYIFAGDVSQDVAPPTLSTNSLVVFVYATGPRAGLGLLGGRFEVNLAATDPRTGATTSGTPQALDDDAGYFSLPDFTGRATFPEITVKMADATAAPAPYGGAFWFFYSSLTDVSYTLTVTDHQSHRVRTYTSSSSSAFCGGADTAAFPP